ncbi:MAG: FAD-dependent oxidoreductase [Pedosphaera sp.]|nr:FAD-dependent oxidoreductase [Pedosphaera sp.]
MGMTATIYILRTACVVAVCLAQISRAAELDVCVYGGTSGGVAAAVQARRMGRTVVLIEPTKRLGGLTTGGLGQTDIGNKAAIGGIAREFYQRIHAHYQKGTAWKWQARETYRDGGQTQTGTGEDTMWTFEPSAALKVMNDLVREAGVEVVYGERLNRKDGVKKDGARIVSIAMESGRVFEAKMFIDATYEGDLLAATGASYTVGREANSQYNETLNGVQTKNARHHQFVTGVDPHVKKGDAASGLLPFIESKSPDADGAGDRRVQAYNFRMCLTDHPENRIPFAKPDGYDEQWYELLFRNYEAGYTGIPWNNAAMPNRKTDVNNNHGFSTDFIGQNYAYPEASDAEREKIVARHRFYQIGLMWTLGNHPRVPVAVRKEVSRWGKCKDEFADTDHWQEQIYVREARRMVGEQVMTQHHCQGRVVAEDAVGMAAYTMDSHNIQRHVDARGHVRNEGDVQVGGFPPYPISYRSLVPKSAECPNLLVPVCLSATHIAYGSIRMEPVFMVLGQSAATAALHAIDEKVAVQKVDYTKLRARLLADKQALEWKGPKAGPPPVRLDVKLDGIVMDEADAKGAGDWTGSNSQPWKVGAGYVHDGNSRKGEMSLAFAPQIKEAGEYEIILLWPPFANRATNVPVTVALAGAAPRTVKVNQRDTRSGGVLSLGKYPLAAGMPVTVTVSNKDTDAHVVCDAVQFRKAK